MHYKNPNLRYERGDIFPAKGVHSNEWHCSEAIIHLEQRDQYFYIYYVNLCWMHDDGTFEHNINTFKDDTDAMRMSKFEKFDNNVFVFEMPMKLK
jgi:hypothetical protein